MYFITPGVLLVSMSLLPLSLLAYSAPNLNKTCLNKCATSFGKKLGGINEVSAYSNCSNDCESSRWHYVKLNNNSLVKTGMKWQCVEYARRWLITQKGYTFASIDHAYQIWNLKTATQLTTQEKKSWLHYTNGITKEKPQPHDLLIYNTIQGVHGHVSVIVGVEKEHILIAEQNYANTLWEQQSYARRIKLIKKNGHYHLADKGVIGWMRVAR
ncbi:CHAP domain-containing protein [Legionella lytica]|uniref:CHAP domain-containing protein n=1 Tax=Legionella lytica TaxID=96232 RepID=A0ABW8D7S8_9GAMM